MIKRLLFSLLFFVGALSAQERLEVELVNISPSFWYKNDVGVTVDASQLASNVTDAAGGAITFTAAGAVKPQLTRADNLENQAIGSEAFDNGAYWAVARSNVVGNTVANPLDGALTADTHREDGSNNTHPLYNNGAYSAVAGRTYRWGVYVKRINRDISLRFETAFSGYAHFNLATGTVSSVSGCAANATITPLTDGWYRVSAECVATATGNAYLDLYPASPAGATSYQGTLNQGTFYVFGAQFQDTAADATYLATSGYPQYRGVAGYKGLRFNGSSQYMTSTSTLANLFAVGNKTVFAVYRPDIITTSQMILTGSAGIVLLFGADASEAWWGNNDGPGIDYTDRPIIAGTTTILVGKHVGGNLIFSVNNGATHTVASGNSSSLAGTLILGYNGATKYLSATLAELITFDRSLNDAEVAAIYRYLSFKYGV